MATQVANDVGIPSLKDSELKSGTIGGVTVMGVFSKQNTFVFARLGGDCKIIKKESIGTFLKLSSNENIFEQLFPFLTDDYAFPTVTNFKKLVKI